MKAASGIHARVHGRVQGVAFREYTRREAQRLGLNGWVRNRIDGTVEVWAEGPASQLKHLLDWLAVGSPFSHVAQVEYTDVSAQGMEDGFAIRSTT